MDSRHAYLIVAHNQFPLLQKLLQLLDDPRNDIFLHIDKKATVDLDALRACVRSSKLTLVPRIRAQWGGYSLIRCQMLLMREAAKGNYRYFHLLSGADLPIRSQDEIHAFFRENDGTEFVSVDAGTEGGGPFRHRFQYYHLFSELLGKEKTGIARYLAIANRYFLAAQRLLGIDRTRRLPVELYKGTNWFSVTDGFLRYVLSKERFVGKYFWAARCPEEFYMQTLAMSSPFRDRLANDSLRFMIWGRTSPRTLLLSDYEAMRESGKLWARKFDGDSNPEIVEKLFSELRPF